MKWLLCMSFGYYRLGTRKCLVIVFAYFLKHVVGFIHWPALRLPHPRKSLDNISKELGVCQVDKDMQKSHDDGDDVGELVIRMILIMKVVIVTVKDMITMMRRTTTRFVFD